MTNYITGLESWLKIPTPTYLVAVIMSYRFPRNFVQMYYLVTSGNNAMILGCEMQQATHRRQKTISVNYATQRCATKLCYQTL